MVITCINTTSSYGSCMTGYCVTAEQVMMKARVSYWVQCHLRQMGGQATGSSVICDTYRFERAAQSESAKVEGAL